MKYKLYWEVFGPKVIMSKQIHIITTDMSFLSKSAHLFSSCTNLKHKVVPCLSNKPTCYGTKMINQKKRLAEKWKWTKKQEQKKMIALVVKHERKWNYGRNSWPLGFDTAAIRGTVNMDADKLQEGKLTDINEESSCNEKVTDIPVEVIPVKTHIKDKVRDILQHWNTKKSKLEADPNLEKYDNWPRQRKVPHFISIVYQTVKTNTSQIILDKCFCKEIKYFSMCLMFYLNNSKLNISFTTFIPYMFITNTNRILIFWVRFFLK